MSLDHFDEDSPNQSGNRRRPLRVIIVDGRAPRAEMLALHLMSAGCRCMATSDVEAALAAVRERAPDLVVIDVDLARGAGHDLAQQVRMLAGGAVRLIAATTHEVELDRLLASPSAFDTVALRPVGITDLLGDLDAARAARAP